MTIYATVKWKSAVENNKLCIGLRLRDPTEYAKVRSTSSCTVSDGRRRSSLWASHMWSPKAAASSSITDSARRSTSRLKPRLSVQFCNPATWSTVQVAEGQVGVVDSFVYLGSTIESTGGSRREILHRIGFARSCMNLLVKRIWKSSIRLNTKLCLPDVPSSSLAVRVWNVVHNEVPLWPSRRVDIVGHSEDLSNRLPYIRHILWLLWTLSCTVTNRRLCLFGRIVRSLPDVRSSSSFSRIINPKASFLLEAADRKTQLLWRSSTGAQQRLTKCA